MGSVLLLFALLASGLSTEEWRAEREAELKSEESWLSLSGLFWLKEGENPAGSAPGSTVQLPVGFPARIGVFLRRGGTVEFIPASGDVKLDGKPVGRRVLADDRNGKPDMLRVGRLRLNVIDRSPKFGVRLRDPEAPARRNFTGLRWYSVDPKWRIDARFVPQKQTIRLSAQTGGTQAWESPGYAEFEHGGETYRLRAVMDEGVPMYVFRDRTAGKTTYPAARFLKTDHPQNGRVVLDFNRAYNPPCVFTPYATCPLPGPENRLPFAVEAGEKMYGK